LVLSPILIGGAVSAQVLVDEDFNSPDLNWTYWCPCQINMERAPITFPQDPDKPGNRFARINVDEASLGGKVCRKGPPAFGCRPPGTVPPLVAFNSQDQVADEPDRPEPLGPSLIPRSRVSTLLADIDRANIWTRRLRGIMALLPSSSAKDPHCSEEIERRAAAAGEEGLCMQRQELRLQDQYSHAADQPYLYSVRFRMPAAIEDRTNTVRWVTAQWKQEPISDTYRQQFGDEWAPSPFLAQRFDNGVLHVTVQDEHCRCKIASAPNPDGSNPVWTDGPARYCASTKPGDPDNSSCTPNLNLTYGPNPVLPTALGQWVEMRYRAQASRSGAAIIEIYAGDRFIVRATGKIGYEPHAGERSGTKFKIGHYRDYLPSAHTMDIDWLRIERLSSERPKDPR
jgi:hypothetical protein